MLKLRKYQRCALENVKKIINFAIIITYISLYIHIYTYITILGMMFRKDYIMESYIEYDRYIKQ